MMRGGVRCKRTLTTGAIVDYISAFIDPTAICSSRIAICAHYLHSTPPLGESPSESCHNYFDLLLYVYFTNALLNPTCSIRHFAMFTDNCQAEHHDSSRERNSSRSFPAESSVKATLYQKMSMLAWPWTLIVRPSKAARRQREHFQREHFIVFFVK